MVMASTMIVIALGACLGLPTSAATQPVCQIDPNAALTHSMSFDLSATDLIDPNANLVRFEFTDDDVLEASKNNIGAEVIVGLLKSVGIDVPQVVIDVVTGVGDFSFVKIEPILKPFLKLDQGAYYEVGSIEKGADAQVTYPVDVDIKHPSSNSFKCGDKVQIDTSPKFGNSSQLSVDPAFYEMELGFFVKNLKFQIGIGLKVSGCVGLPIDGECVGASFDEDFYETIPLLDIPIDINQPLINLCQEAFAGGAGLEDLIGCGSDLSDDSKSIFAIIQSTLEKEGLTFVEFEEGKVIVKTPDIPIGGPPVPEALMEFSAPQKKNELNFEHLDGGRKLKLSGTKEIANAQIDLIDIMSLLVGVDTSFSLGGDTLSVDIGDLAPTLFVEQDVTYEFDASILITFNLSIIMDYEVINEAGNVIAKSSNSVVKIKAGHSLSLTYPNTLQEPTDLISSYSIDGELDVKVDNKFFRSVSMRLFQVGVGGDEFTLLETEVAKKEIDHGTIENHKFSLSGDPKSFLESPVRLDPERPVLELDLQVLRVSNIGNGERAVTVQVDATNDGDVPLCDLELFTATTPGSSFGECLTSPHFDLNNTYGDPNGQFNLTNMLALAQGLEVSEDGSIQVRFIATPDRPAILLNGCFDVASTELGVITSGNGASPIGTLVENGLNECTGARRTERNEIKVNIGSRKISSLSDFALYAYDGIELSSGMAVSTGDVGSSRDLVITPPCDTLVGTTPENPGELRGTMHVGDDLKVKGDAHFESDYAQIGGKLIVGSKSGESKSTRLSKSAKSVTASSLVFLGASSENSDCVKTFDAPFSKSSKSSDMRSSLAKAGKSARSIDVSGDEEILPGEYNEITVEEGAKLRILPGNYTIHKLVVEADASVIANVPPGSTVLVEIEQWEFRCGNNGPMCSKSSKSENAHLRRLSAKSMKEDTKECSFSLLVESGGLPNQLMVHYYGDELSFQGAQLQGTLNAINAAVSLDGGTSLTGSLYASTIFVGIDSSFVGNRELIERNNTLCNVD